MTLPLAFGLGVLVGAFLLWLRVRWEWEREMEWFVRKWR